MKRPTSKRKRTARPRYAQMKHPFLTKMILPDGTFKVGKVWAKVRHATQSVLLTLEAEHVRKSMKLDGVGNTATCSMAICSYDHKDAFPHHVEGYIDWNFSRAFVVSKLDAVGLPCECVAYEHDDDTARLNDTKGGQQELLRRLETNGPKTITLRPIRYRSEVGRPGRDRKGTGVRDPLKRHGANLRYAVREGGALPEEKLADKKKRT